MFTEIDDSIFQSTLVFFDDAASHLGFLLRIPAASHARKTLADRNMSVTRVRLVLVLKDPHNEEVL